MSPQQNKLRATFRVAAWGSLPNDAVALNSGSWQVVGAPAPACVDVPPDLQMPVNGMRRFHCAWPTTQPPATWNGFQSLLVELRGDGLTFVRDSAYRTLFFDTVSLSKQVVAVVSSAGLPKLGARREMMFVVRTANMPVSGPGQPAFDPMVKAEAAAAAQLAAIDKLYPATTKQPHTKQRQQPDQVQALRRSLQTVKATAGGGGPTKAMPGQLRHVPAEVLDQVMPMIVVDVFHETKEQVGLPARQRRVFRSGSRRRAAAHCVRAAAGSVRVVGPVGSACRRHGRPGGGAGAAARAGRLRTLRRGGIGVGGAADPSGVGMAAAGLGELAVAAGQRTAAGGGGARQDR